jgi:hypothetical protein
VAVSSEHQLDTSGVDVLLLYVVELDRAQPGAEEAFTLSQVAQRLTDRIRGLDDASSEVFETLLYAGGFAWEHDYSEWNWLRGGGGIFTVTSGFPRISAAELPGGVLNVKYTIALPQCEPFRITDESFIKLISGVTDAN